MPTDKQRLDWLTIKKTDVGYAYALETWGVSVYPDPAKIGFVTYKGNTPRQAIDAAMKAEGRKER